MMTQTKLVWCVDCTAEVEVSKFASAKSTRCEGCKERNYGQKIGNRKAPTAPVKGTKHYYIEQLITACELFNKETEKLNALVDEGLAKYGIVIAYGSHNNFDCRWFYGMNEGEVCKLYGTGKRKTTVKEYRHCLNRINRAIAEIDDLVADHRR